MARPELTPVRASCAMSLGRTGLGILVVAVLAASSAMAGTLRLATWNVELVRAGPGLLLRDILSDADPQVTAAPEETTASDADETTASDADETAAAAESSSPHQSLREPALLELEELLSARLDTRVNVSIGAKRGRIVVEFADLDDLERIYRIITPHGATAGD